MSKNLKPRLLNLRLHKKLLIHTILIFIFHKLIFHMPNFQFQIVIHDIQHSIDTENDEEEEAASDDDHSENSHEGGSHSVDPFMDYSTMIIEYEYIDDDEEDDGDGPDT